MDMKNYELIDAENPYHGNMCIDMSNQRFCRSQKKKQ